MRSKRNLNNLGLVGAVLIILLAITACGQTNNDAAGNEVVNIPDSIENIDIIEVDEIGSTAIDADNLETTLDQFPSDELTPEEIEGLLFMREEEKLAQDVYLQLAEIWDLRIFGNIARSEATHTEAIRSLIDRYGLEDPAATTDVGVFTNPVLQELNDQLVAEGSKSLADALRVGLAIEEIDILDLEEYLAQTDKEDIILVYNNLLKGSRNHLRAFVSSLESQTGETYQPQYLSQEAFDSIINSPSEKGGSGRGQGGKGMGGNSNKVNP